VLCGIPLRKFVTPRPATPISFQRS
jgi:hypothetical protein